MNLFKIANEMIIDKDCIALVILEKVDNVVEPNNWRLQFHYKYKDSYAISSTRSKKDALRLFNNYYF